MEPVGEVWKIGMEECWKAGRLNVPRWSTALHGSGRETDWGLAEHSNIPHSTLPVLPFATISANPGDQTVEVAVRCRQFEVRRVVADLQCECHSSSSVAHEMKAKLDITCPGSLNYPMKALLHAGANGREPVPNDNLLLSMTSMDIGMLECWNRGMMGLSLDKRGMNLVSQLSRIPTFR